MKKTPKSEEVSQESGESKAKSFLAEMKKTLSQVNFNLVVRALQSYKTSDDLQALLTATAFLSEDGSSHSLLRGWCSAPQPQGLTRKPGEEAESALLCDRDFRLAARRPSHRLRWTS